MTTFGDMVTRLKSFDVKTEAVKAIVKTRSEYIVRNKKQMKKGERPETTLIGGYAFDWYRDMKRAMNPEAGGMVDLEFTGQFKLGMFLKIEGETIIMGSSDEKALQLEGKYGKTPFYGLNSENQQSYNFDVFLPVFMDQFKEKTGLTPG